MTDKTKIKRKTLREFNDAGTGASYLADKEYEFEPGALANYEAAGLVEREKASTKASVEA